jgi:hypothetical protein
MFNNKVIVISGFRRGGTNILWNILQSHPSICSAGYESGYIFKKNKVISLFRKTGLLKSRLSQLYLDYHFYRLKLQKNYLTEENKFKYPDTEYTKEEVAGSILCFKSVDRGINYTEILKQIYPDIYFIALTRNGYAIADGHSRRGKSIKDTGTLYSEVAGKMQDYSKELPNFKLIKFEEMIQAPFQTSRELFEFIGCNPVHLAHLRLKSKKIIRKDGTHASNYGKPGKKYWFDKTGIDQIIDPDINKKQIQRLSGSLIQDFNRYAEPALKFFGYDVMGVNK